jgi:transcriptional regulator with XRE-family HTH domain
MPIAARCELRPNVGMSRSLKDIANRLEATREALGVTAAELCRRTGIKPNAWSQFVNPSKKRRITLSAAYRLRDEFRISLDWIYDGDPSGLPDRIIQKLRKAA